LTNKFFFLLLTAPAPMNIISSFIRRHALLHSTIQLPSLFWSKPLKNWY